MKLKDKVAIVTGGGQGIGRGIVLCLAEEGADAVILTKSGASGQEVAEEVKKMGHRSLAIKADVTDNQQVDQAVQKAIDTFGKIDILVNSVGGGSVAIAPFLKLEGAEWDRTFELNLKSQVFMCRAVVPHFIKQGSGKIVNIGSRLARLIDIPLTVYSAAKAAVVHYTKHLAAELAPHNINVNAVCPGDVLTPKIEVAFARMAQTNPEAAGKTPEELFLQVAGPRMAFKRLQTPEDIGRAVVFLASEDARNITGQALYVDGGQTFI